MNSSFLKKALPHVIAIVVFLIVAAVYCKPVLEGKVLSQTDVIGHKAMAEQSIQFKAKYGYYPLWSESMFGGMPTYTIQLPSNSTIVNYIGILLSFGSPFNPISLFFIACVCFYILTQVLRVNPWAGALAALAYAYSSFDPIIISVGHNTQMAAIGYAPAVVAGLILIYEGKYLLGAACLTLFLALQLSITQHLQIVYYTGIIMGFISVAFLVRCIREKNNLQQAITAFAIAAVAGAIGVATNAVALLPVQEYAKETMRGGRSELSDNKGNKTKGGLDKDYAFNWSYGLTETFTLFVPGVYGGGTGTREFTESSKMADKLQEIGFPEANALQYANHYSYWGTQGGSLGTAGPVYLGAVVCFLFFLGLVYVKSWHKWWILGATVFGILLAWGKNFSSINYFLFDHMPFYSKFRSPTMALVIPQLTVPLLGALGLTQLINSKDPFDIKWKKFKNAAFLTVGLLALVAAFYFTADFKGFQDAALRENFTEGYLQQVARGKQPTPEMQQQAVELSNSIFKNLQADRQSIFLSDLLRTFILVAVALALTYFYLKDKIKPVVLLAGLLVLSSYDLLAEGRKFLSDENFLEPADLDAIFTATAADSKIKADPEKNFRVFDETDQQNGPFSDSRASFFHNSVGGYHPAKLGLYQDIIEKQLSKGNMMVFNMLNTKYFIQRNPANGQPDAIVNHGAFGPCWLVKSVQFVDNADEEMKSLDSVNLRDTAIVRKDFKNVIKFMPEPDSTATIKLIENKNDVIDYQFTSKANQFTVFSEVYYDRGWNAYLDGKKTDYCKVDYVLRGMPVPAGTHTIEFRFEPHSYRLGETISWMASILAYILIGFAAVRVWKNGRPKQAAA
jgi:hypothetical protein